MPTLDQNRRMWSDTYDWSGGGAEWSERWGSPESQWYGSILPRLHGFLPVGTILEIAPGFGRWTHFLRSWCDRLIVVDLSPKCIEACKVRFEHDPRIDYHVNDGKSLDFVDESSIDLVFSFDSLVHADADVIRAYLAQFPSKLRTSGVAFLHHSNLGEHRKYLNAVARLPTAVRSWLERRGWLEALEAQWRDREMSAGALLDIARLSGLQCVSQELINWESKRLIDCISVLTPGRMAANAATPTLRNHGFAQEAKSAARRSAFYAASAAAAGRPRFTSAAVTADVTDADVALPAGFKPKN